MLRIIQNSTADGAKSYYSTADYYSEGQELTGVWKGKAAERLGLSGEVDKADWDALCDNLDPATGATLTARQKQDRRVGYDFNFHVPKSVSVLYGLTQDDRILAAFREAVDSTMTDMEAEVQTRVRAGGKNEDRTTGNLVWGEFVHTTARPVDGVPDPHLHAHCFVFNTTWDGQEGRWKAGQFSGLKRDAPYFEAVFHSRLARNFAELGLPIERTKNGWELAGFSAETLKKFSRRTTQIEEKAREKGITDPKEKGELGAKTRSGKSKELSLGELRDVWSRRLSSEEGGAVSSTEKSLGDAAIPEDKTRAGEAVALALGHCFERRSVVPERTLLAAAMKGAYGSASPESVSAELDKQPLLHADRNGRRCVTTREVLAEERAMVDFARAGRGACRPLAAGEHTFQREWLNENQRRAVSHVLGSRDRVTIIRGGAGTGKTTVLKEMAEAIEATGRKVFAFAPSADASRTVLRNDGFANADTVARLLLDEKMQAQIRGQVILIDEAGLLGSKATAQVFDLASKLEARVILSGDRGQHGSVERGSALKLLEDEAGLVPAEIREIQRQKGDYKRAVQALSEGRTDDGFHQLDQRKRPTAA
jgi:conjugative relaxase-like TrwC/TraI family protein